MFRQYLFALRPTPAHVADDYPSRAWKALKNTVSPPADCLEGLSRILVTLRQKRQALDVINDFENTPRSELRGIVRDL